MNTSTAQATIERVSQVFATYDLPVLLERDNGPCFTNDEFKRFLKLNGIRQIFTAPYHTSPYDAQVQTGTEEEKNGRESNPQNLSTPFPILF